MTQTSSLASTSISNFDLSNEVHIDRIIYKSLFDNVKSIIGTASEVIKKYGRLNFGDVFYRDEFGQLIYDHFKGMYTIEEIKEKIKQKFAYANAVIKK